MPSLTTQRVLNFYYASGFCMDGAFFLILAAIPYKVLALGGGAVELGLLPAIGAVAYIVFTLMAGYLGDRMGRTWLCLAGNLMLILFAFLAYRCTDLKLLLLLMPLLGLGKALYWPGVQATVGDMSTPAELERNIGRFNVAWSAGKAFGFLSSGILLGLFGFRTTFLCGAGLVVLAFLFLPKGRFSETAGKAQEDEIQPEPKSEFRLPSKDRDSRRTFRYMAWLANLAAYGAGAVLSSHLPEWFTELGWGERRFGLFLGLIFLTQTVSFMLLAGKIRYTFSVRRLMLPQLVAGLIMLALPWFPGMAWYLAAGPLLGAAFGLSYAASIFYSLHTRSGKGMNAGIHESIIGVGGFLPPLLGGLLAHYSGWLGAPYLLAAGFIFLVLLLQQFIWWRHLHRTASIFIFVCGVMVVSTMAQAGEIFPWKRSRGPEPVYPEIVVSVDEVAAQVDDQKLVVLDARPLVEYHRGHIPGAVNIPSHVFADSVSTVLKRHWPEHDPSQIPVVIYCYGRNCIRSRNCSSYLARHGFIHLEWFRTGWDGWQEMGGEKWVIPESRR